MTSDWWSILSWVEWLLVGALSVTMVYEVYFYVRYIAAVGRKSHLTSPQGGGELPGVSVIVCARNEAHNIRPYLQALLTQDYPTYEVIVVNDGSQDDTREAIEWYMVRDTRVKMTFVPHDAHVGSTKKLAITLGAKAAQYDYLLLTDADCRPESKLWIKEMMQGFAKPETDIVLGYGAYFVEKGALNGLIQYDTLFNGLHYMGMALNHRPYMGVGRNLAYRKDFFFASGGFTGLMTSRSGDDDLFVNKTATAANTAVVVGANSMTWSVPKQTWKEWLQQKRRHLSVSPRYSSRSKLHLALEPMVRGVFYALVIAMAVLSVGAWMGWSMPFNPWVGVGAVGALFLRWLMQWVILLSASVRLHQRRFGLSIVWYDVVLPVINLYIFVTAPFKRNRHW